MPYTPITSTQNSKVKLAVKLRGKRGRDQEQRFLVDYHRDMERALDNAYKLDFAFYCEALASEEDRILLEAVPPTHVYEVPEQVMQKASYRQNPGGILGVMHTKDVPHISHLAVSDTPILGLVNLQKPGNIGALLRTADATGFTTLLIDTALDLYNPNIIRSSTGTCFLDSIYQASSQDAIDFFTQNAYRVISAHLDGTVSLFDTTLTERTAIILGTEDIGLDAIWVSHCDTLVKIPMIGHVADSLNVSVSGAVFMYEALRQRLAPT